MTDQPPQEDQSQPVATAAKSAAVPLSDHAEDMLAEAVGHDLELVTDEQEKPLKNVKEVLTEMIADKDELAITLEYGTGESGVDQASWEIEVTSLQRAFMRKQKAAEVDLLASKLSDQIAATKGCVDNAWIERTGEFRDLMKLFEQPNISRQEIDDYQHRIFGRDEYLNYLESVLDVTDIRKLMNAVGNLNQVAQQLEEDYKKLIDPTDVDNSALADEIIAAEGDIDALSIEYERDFASAILRKNLTLAAQFTDIINPEFLKEFKLWAHSLDLNIREVLATEKSATNGRITDKSRDQIKDMLSSGAGQVNKILQAVA
jgi:hypothetical protein